MVYMVNMIQLFTINIQNEILIELIFH